MTQPKDTENLGGTGGGAHIDGDVQTETFVGRDQIINLGPLKIDKYFLVGIIAAIFIMMITVVIGTAWMGDIRDSIVVTPTPTLTASSTPTATSTSTYTLTPTYTPLPTSTPFPVQPAAEDEILILITDFYLARGIDDSEPHGQIAKAISQQIKASNLENVRVGIDPNVALRENEQERAREIAERYNASIIIWGDETSVDFTVNFFNLRQPEFEATNVTIEADSTSVHKAALANPEPYIQFVTKGLPTQMTFLALFAVGQAEYNQGEYSHATIIIEQVIQMLGNQTIKGLDAAYFRLGWLHQGPLEQLEKAIPYYNEALQLNPNSSHVYYNRGLAFYDKGDYEQAIGDYSQAIALDPNDAIAYNNRGIAYRRLGQYEQAIEDYDQAIALDANDATTYYNRGIVYAALDNYEQAIRDYSRAISLNTGYAPAYYKRGLAYYGGNDTERAIVDYNQAVSLDPDYTSAYVGLGIVYTTLGNYEQAIRNYNQAIVLEPNDATAYYNRGIAYRRLRRYEQAIEDYGQAIALEPGNATAYYNRGIAYRHLRKYEQAIENYDQAISLNPGYVAAYVGRGLAYATLGDYEKAIENYGQAIVLSPDNATVYNSRGLAYSALGRYEQAMGDYGQAIVLKPDYVAAYNNRGLAYYYKGEYKQAIENHNQAIDLAPDDAVAYNILCWLHGLWQEPEKALPYCTEAVSKASIVHRPSFRDSRGITYALLDEIDKAIEDFQAFVEAFEGDSRYTQNVAKRKAWIRSLQSGKNPFTPEVLEAMRQE